MLRVMLVAFIGLGVVACGPSKEEIAAAERRREEAAAAEEAEKKKAEEQIVQLDAATKAAVSRMVNLLSAFDASAKSVPVCTGDRVNETVKPLPVRWVTLSFAKGGLQKLYESWSPTDLDGDVFFRLFGDKPRDDAARQRAAAAAKIINEAKHVAVIDERVVTFPKVDPTVNLYTPGESTANVVLFSADKPVCKVAGQAKNADEVDAVASDDPTLRNLHADDALAADLRKRLMADVTKNMKAALGERFAGFAEQSP